VTVEDERRDVHIVPFAQQGAEASSIGIRFLEMILANGKWGADRDTSSAFAPEEVRRFEVGETLLPTLAERVKITVGGCDFISHSNGPVGDHH
jgi:hypothetical protein